MSVSAALQHIQFRPSTEDPFWPAELSEADMEEYALLSLPDDTWSKFTMTLTEDGAPMAYVGKDGALVINDPELAEWDRQARANAEAMDVKRG